MADDNPLGVSSKSTATDRLFGFSTSVESKEDSLFGGVSQPNPTLDVLEVSRDTNPDEVAQARNTAAELNTTAEVVEANPEAAGNILRRSATERLLRSSEVTNRFLSDTSNARVAHDSVDNLGFVEGLGNGLVRGWLGLKQSYHQIMAEEELEDIQDAGKSYGQLLEESTVVPGLPGPLDHMRALQRYVSSRIMNPDPDAYIASQKRVGELMDERALLSMSATSRRFMEGVEEAEGFLGKLTAAVSDPIGMSTFSAEVGVEFLPQLLAASSVTLATRSPVAGAAALGLGSASTERFRSPGEFLEAAGIDLSDPTQLDVLLRDPELMRQAQEFGFTRGAIIGAFDALGGGLASRAIASNPMASLLLQTLAQGTLGGLGEATAQLATTGEVDLNEVIFEAVGEFATTPIEVAGVGGRPLVTRVRDAVNGARAEAAVEGMEQMSEALQESPLSQRAPDVAAQHMSEVLEANDLPEVYVPASAIMNVEGSPNLVERLGVEDQMTDAQAFDGDVVVGSKEFSQHVLQDPEVFEQLKGHVRVEEEGLTHAESGEQNAEIQATVDEAAAAVEQEIETTEEVVSRDTTAAENPDTEAAVQIAEHEAGVAALFQSADAAGFTENQYATYVEAIRRQRDQSRRRAEARKLNREKKRLDKQYQSAREALRPEVEESVSQLPTYNALNGIGVDRLDRAAVREIFQGDEKQMNRLPRQGGRRIYTAKGQKGLDPDQYADLYGFRSGDVMLFSMLDNPTFEEAVEAELTRKVEEQNPTLVTARGRVEEAKEALHAADDHGIVLAFELARLRQMRGQGRIKRSLIRARAKTILEGYRVGRIQPGQFEVLQRRESRRARAALRAGDIEAAARHKLNQAMAFEMTRESYRIREELNRGNKAMRRIQNTRQRKRGTQRGIPVEYLERAQEALSAFSFGSQRPNSRRLQQALDQATVEQEPGESLQQWSKRKLDAEGIVMEIGDTVVEANGTTHWRNMTLTEWRDLRNTVKSIEQAGRDVDKLRRETEALGVRDIAADIKDGIEVNIARRGPRVARSVSQTKDVRAITTVAENVSDAANNFKVSTAGLLLNTDSVLRMIDGFESLGTAYTYIKGGIDRAYSDGYLPGQVGVVRRMRDESRKLVKLFDMFSKTERNMMWREQDIPGVRTRLSRFEQIGVLLNMGNAGNIQAMVKSGQFTEAELQAVVNNASKRDMDFVQGVWDFLAEFEPEIKETVRRRQNRNPVMVEAQPVETPHGTYRGGYFPLHYDTERAVFDKAVVQRFDFAEARDMMLRGGFTASHTQDGHTQTREGSGGRAVKLDPFVINHHLNQLVYDLEMGDAVHDSYKVLHNREVKKAFSDQGVPQLWDALDLWLGDTITGEIHRGGMVERALRHIRTGTTISKLAFNFSTAALQPLGLLQTAVQIGKGNTIMGLYDLAGGRGQNPYNVYKWVSDQSTFMAERERNFNKDVHDAQHNLHTGMLSKITPGKTSDYLADSLFLFIAKAQRFVDMVTWLGARRQGLKMFPNDAEKATLHADRMVARAQGTGIFHERTSFERGTIATWARNTEVVRAWSLFLSYFAAKTNVAWERTKKADFRRNPSELINYPVDMAMLFMVEGVLAALIKEGLDEDPDNDLEELAGLAVWEGVKNFSAGIPLARETVSAAEGFNTGGAIGGFAGAVANAGVQIKQGEIDMAAVKSINNVMGVLFKYPTSQVHKTGQAYWEDTPWNDIRWWEYLTGPRRNTSE